MIPCLQGLSLMQLGSPTQLPRGPCLLVSSKRIAVHTCVGVITQSHGYAALSAHLLQSISGLSWGAQLPWMRCSPGRLSCRTLP